MTTDRPRLRPGLAAQAVPSGHVVVYDRLRLSDRQLSLPPLLFEAARLFDGASTLLDVQLRLVRLTGERIVPLRQLEQLASALGEALFLDSPAYRAAVAAPVRGPVCVGVYEGDPQALREQFRAMFDGDGASGHPRGRRDDGKVRAALLPHIDFARGGTSYTWPLKEVVESTPARLFVIVGTSHHSAHRFTLTRKHFATPLGVVPTDAAYVDRLAALYGEGLFDDEIQAHLPEHSIELEVVLLQYLYENVRDVRIVPLVVGSFHDCVRSGASPGDVGDVRRMADALAQAEREAKEPVCYLISGDLAHIGPKFDDPEPVGAEALAHSRRQDQELLRHAGRADADAYFRVVAAEGDARRICGLPPTWLTLTAARPSRGRLVHYGQYVHPRGHESVSFAGMVFDA